MEKVYDILKIRYTIYTFDILTMSAHTRDVYELLPDGKILYNQYEKGNRKATIKNEERTTTPEAFLQLCKQLNSCLATADRNVEYDDDIGAEARIYRAFGRVDILDRGYGNATTDVGTLLHNYLFDVAGYCW